MKLNEKAAIDWNNYLDKDEIAKFLQGDDKIESAEDIIYSKEFASRFSDLHNDLQKKYNNSWTKRELVKDLADFYYKGHLITEDLKLEEAIVDKKVFGAKTPDIGRYTKQIVSGVFPILKDKYNIDMAPDPINQRHNVVTYVGSDFRKTRVVIDFNTNHREFEEDGGNQVFSNVFYGMRGAKAGSYNLNNAEETADTLVYSLEQIGFKTQDKLNQEEIDAYNKKIADREAAEKKVAEAREKRKKDQEIIDFNKRLGKENEPEEPEESEIEQEEDFSTALTECIDELRKRNEINSSIHIAFQGDPGFSIDCFYISYNQYFLRSEDLELDTLMKLDDMVKYLTTLSEKYEVTACNTYTAPGDKTPEKGLTIHLFS